MLIDPILRVLFGAFKLLYYLSVLFSLNTRLQLPDRKPRKNTQAQSLQ